jgi:hypothetical protein
MKADLEMGIAKDMLSFNGIWTMAEYIYRILHEE